MTDRIFLNDKDKKDELQVETNAKVRESLGHSEALVNLMKYILDGFGHRYITSTKSPRVETQMISENEFQIISLDDDMPEILKVSNKGLKNKLISYAKSIPTKEKPTVGYKIAVNLVEGSFTGPGLLRVSAWVDWDFPMHRFTKSHNSNADKSFVLAKEFSFEEVLDIRNELPLVLEEVCEVFI